MDTDDTFVADNDVNSPGELDYTRVSEYIRSAEAFSNSTYQNVYIIDYFKRNFLYVSPNPVFQSGLIPEQMMEVGFGFFPIHVDQDEKTLLLDINRSCLAFFNRVPVEERKEWYAQYDFHIIDKGHPILVNHKLIPIALTSEGCLWLALCLVSASSYTTPGHIQMHRVGSTDYFEYNRLTQDWERRSVPSLTEGERYMIRLSIQGLSILEIADKMCLSPATIKKYRKQLFNKLGVRNITEAILAATNKKLL